MKKKFELQSGGYKSIGKTCCKQINVNQINSSKRALAPKSRNITKKINRPRFFCKVCYKSPYGPRSDEGPEQYVIYCIVNTGYLTNKGTLAASVARGFLGLYSKVDKDRVKAKALDSWEDSGQKLIVLNGINHRHLVYLADELNYSAVDIHLLYKTLGKSRIILVLSAIGREDYLEEPLDGLTYLR